MEQKSIVERVKDYIGDNDWRIRENSNTSRSFANLQGYLANQDMVDYGLEEVYTGEMSQAHKDRIIHIHDMSHPIVGYCCGWGTKTIVREGFNCGATYVHSTPPHHLRSLFGQINNFIFTMSGEWAGAQALNSLDTYCSAYIKYDNMTYDEVYNELRSLIYNLNVKTRIAMQSPFTNISVDLTVPEDLKYEKAYVGDIETDFTYGDCQQEMNLFNEALCDVMMEGDALHNIFPYPIITYGITKDFPWDSKLAKKIFTFADESNSPYFSNFINSDMDQSDVRSMCPLTPDTKVKVLIDNKVVNTELSNLSDKDFKVYFNGEWKSAKLNKVVSQNLVTITDERQSVLNLGEFHQQVIIRNHLVETVSAKDIRIGDCLIYDDNGTYNFSKVIDYEYTKINRDDLLCVEVTE